MSCTRAHETPIEQLLAAPDSAECADFLAHCASCESCASELERHRRRFERRNPRAASLLLAGGVAVAAVVLVWIAFRSGPDAAPPAPAAPTSTAPSPVPPTPAAPAQAVAPSPAGQTAGHLLVAKQATSVSIEDGQPVAFAVPLGEASQTDEPRPVRLVSTDGRVLDVLGGLNTDRTQAAIEVPADFLLPGRYLVEVKTTETSHFPFRRYVIEVLSEGPPAEP